ncbi:membrane protein [Candidatus Omnitrophus magneticus]|uniref:Membrane protein n=1 Tax=Candidatus Omnitrophus magneticus TaxID=1609969 RepID=A0A0F0CJZ0_9BACT|nr:membrane protein [Candidatus Omnitrophus magneticus]
MIPNNGGFMRFFIRIGIIVYSFIMIATGGLFLAVSLDMVPSDYWLSLMSTIQSSSNIQICLHVVSGFFFIAGIITPLRVSAKLRKDKVITRSRF